LIKNKITPHLTPVVEAVASLRGAPPPEYRGRKKRFFFSPLGTPRGELEGGFNNIRTGHGLSVLIYSSYF